MFSIFSVFLGVGCEEGWDKGATARQLDRYLAASCKYSVIMSDTDVHQCSYLLLEDHNDWPQMFRLLWIFYADRKWVPNPSGICTEMVPECESIWFVNIFVASTKLL